MLGTLIKAQVLENLYGIKFIITFVVCIVLVLAGTISGMAKYDGQLKDQANIKASNDGALREAGSWWDVARTGQKVVKPASKLVLFSSGLEESVGRTATVKQGDFPQMEDSIYSTAPIFAVFGDIDLTFIMKIVISLFAILFTYDLVSGEKERGTLKLCLSNSVPRNTYILGKSIGSFISLLIPLLVPLAIALIIVMTFGGISYTGEEWARIGMLSLSYLLYMLAFFCIGLFVSTMTRNSAVSFLILLFIWVLAVMIVPNGAMLVAHQINPIPSVNEMRAEQLKLRQEFESTVWERTSEEMRKLMPAGGGMPSDDIRRQMRSIRTKIREELEPDYKKNNEKLIDDFKRNQSNLTNLAIALSRLSPASAVTYLGMNLSNTGYADQEDFLRQLTTHREIFTTFIDKEMEAEMGRGRFMGHGPTSTGELDIAALPVMRYQRLGFDRSIELALPDLLSLFLISLIFYLLGFVFFLRYDVR